MGVKGMCARCGMMCRSTDCAVTACRRLVRTGGFTPAACAASPGAGVGPQPPPARSASPLCPTCTTLMQARTRQCTRTRPQAGAQHAKRTPARRAAGHAMRRADAPPAGRATCSPTARARRWGGWARAVYSREPGCARCLCVSFLSLQPCNLSATNQGMCARPAPPSAPTANGLVAGVPPSHPQCKAGCVSCRADALQQCSSCLEGFALTNKTCVPCTTLLKGCSVCKDSRCGRCNEWADA